MLGFTSTAVLLASVAHAAPAQPDIVPSTHPLTGPAPPKGPAPAHGSPKAWTAPANAGQKTGPVTRTAGKDWSGWKDVSKLFVFGDSYSTTGFEPNLTQPSPQFPLGNPTYPGYTASNGPNYVDYLTVKYNQSLVETYNLAYGGATVDSALVTPYEPRVLSFRQQVNEEFFPYYVDENNAGWTSSNSLFVSFFGINDVGNSWYQQNASLNGDIINVYSGLIDELYQAGARNFVFLNVPPVNLAPLTAESGSSAQTQEGADITDFNNRIEQMATNVSTYQDATVFYYDTNAIFSEVLQNPASFPQTALYQNTTEYCTAYENGTPAVDTYDPSCGIPVNEYFWLNSLHPTYPMHDVLAQQIAMQLEAGTVVG